MSTMEDKYSKTKSKKRKIISDYESSSISLNEYSVCHKEKLSQCKENKYKKTCQKKSFDNKKLETSLQQDNKYSDGKSFKETQKEYKEFINHEKDEDKQIELDVWYYLLHHLEESEKLIALKLLVGINKMKKNWKDNFIKNKYVDKKVVDDMKIVIKALQDEKEKNEVEKLKLMQEKNELQKKVLEERKSRIQLAEILANEIEKRRSLSKEQTKEVPNNIDVSNKAEDKQVSQTITEIVSKKEPSTLKKSLNDNNHNSQVSKFKGDTKKEVDLRNILNNRENGGMKEPHINSLSSPFVRHFPTFMPYSHCTKKTPVKCNGQLCVNIKTPIKYFRDVMRIIETKLRMSIRFNKVISLSDGWRVEFSSLNAKKDFVNRKRLFIGTGLFVTNSFRIH